MPRQPGEHFPCPQCNATVVYGVPRCWQCRKALRSNGLVGVLITVGVLTFLGFSVWAFQVLMGR